jgi:hypothetical protein
VEGFADADWASFSSNERYITMYYTFLSGNLVCGKEINSESTI